MKCLKKLDCREKHKIPKQKINFMYQYKNSNLMIAGLSYGYILVLDIKNKVSKRFFYY